jgi:hypothetical protein
VIENKTHIWGEERDEGVYYEEGKACGYIGFDPYKPTCLSEDRIAERISEIRTFLAGFGATIVSPGVAWALARRERHRLAFFATLVPVACIPWCFVLMFFY